MSAQKRPSRQIRIMIFAHDGRGLGHLRRLSRIAAELAQEASVLFITGHRWVANLLPASCEFIHIPSLESIIPHKSRYWGMTPFVEPTTGIGMELRKTILQQCIDAYRPHAFIADFLPMGIDHELLGLLERTEPDERRNYFILRGVLGDPSQVWSDVLTTQAFSVLRQYYDRIFVTCDPQIVDVAAEYKFGADLQEKLAYTGYVAPRSDPKMRDAVREERQLPPDARWVVCSAGGGKDGEVLVQQCWNLSLQYPECYFDIVAGPRSSLIVQDRWHRGLKIRVYQDDFDTMPEKLSAADIVVIRGGYNSLLESAIGNAQIIVWPFDAEQTTHANRLSSFRSMQVVKAAEELESAFATALQANTCRSAVNDLNLNGAKETADAILADVRNSLMQLQPLTAANIL